MSPRPVLVIGIDAANPELLLDWGRRGILPNIGSLLARGLLARSRSLDGFYVGSTWPSLYTGVSPARHGLHYLRQLKRGTYDLHRMAEGPFVRYRPFWSALSDSGRRVLILDVPLSRVDPGINGLQVVEWGGHDSVFGFHASTKETESGILGRFGPHPAGSKCDASRRNTEDYQRFVTALETGARAKGALTADLIRRGPWDFMFQVFTESHCAGHQCWHLHDSGHPNHDPAIRAAVGDPLERVYAAIDSAIGEILAASGDARIFLLVAHGMSHRFGASFLMPAILAGLGVTAAPPVSAPESLMHRLSAAFRRRLPGGARPASSISLPDHYRSSPCFPINNGLATGGIRLNLAGREPDGVLNPGAEADAFVTRLSADLLEILDARTGGPLVRRVMRTSQLYQGEHLADLPDLLVEWNDDAPTGSATVGNGNGAVVRASSPKLGIVEGTNDYGRTGEHRAEGLLLAVGGGIEPGELTGTVSILDIAPTLAALSGVALTGGDGAAIGEMISSE